MAIIEDLTKKQFQMKLGRTRRLYHEGKTPEEIAEIVKRPAEEIRLWIGIIRRYDENQKKTNG